MKYNELKFSKGEIIIFAVIAVLLFFGLIIFSDINMNNLLDSDASNELILAKYLSEKNELITKGWQYSTEIRVFYTQFISALLFKFSDSFHFVRLATLAICHILAFISLYLYLQSLKLQKYFLIFVCILLLPFSVIYADYYLLKPYYVFHFIALCLVLYFINIKSIILISILSFILGLSGIRYLTILFFPMVMSKLTVLFDLKKLEISKKDIVDFARNEMSTFTGCFFYIIGLMINLRVFTKIFAFVNVANTSFTNFNINTITQIFNGFLNFFGYSIGKFILSFPGFALSSITIVFTIIFVRYYFKNINQFNDNQRFNIYFVLYAYVTFIITNIVFDHGQYRDRYLMPFSLFTFVLLFLLTECINISVKLKKALIYITFIILLFTSLINYYKLSSNVSRDTINRQLVCNYLLDNDLNYGYANFWDGGVITELTNGKVEVWSWDTSNDFDKIGQKLGWLQYTSHYTTSPSDFTDKYFILVNKSISNLDEFKDKHNLVNLCYENDSYLLYLN